jgi:hypothetical protein
MIRAITSPAGLTLALATLAASPSLSDAFLHAPLDRFSALSFLIWLAPLIFLLSNRLKFPAIHPSRSSTLVALALLSLAASALLSIHALAHSALALALAALCHAPHLRLTLWLIAAFAWMPASGWLTATWPAAAAIRLALASLGALALLLPSPVKPPPPSPLA